MCTIKVSRASFFFLILVTFFATFASADTVILRSGASYYGQLVGGPVTFADAQGVKYEFPARDVQSLVFAASDVITLRSGKTYSGHFTGANPVDFRIPKELAISFPPMTLTRSSSIVPELRPRPAAGR